MVGKTGKARHGVEEQENRSPLAWPPSTSSRLKASAIQGRSPRAALRAYAQGERTGAQLGFVANQATF